MTRTALAIAASAAILSFAAGPSRAQTYGNAPWCAVLELGTGEVQWVCEYASAAACAPNVTAGNRGFCNRNPYFAAERALPPAPRYRHHHRYYR